MPGDVIAGGVAEASGAGLTGADPAGAPVVLVVPPVTAAPRSPAGGVDDGGADSPWGALAQEDARRSTAHPRHGGSRVMVRVPGAVREHFVHARHGEEVRVFEALHSGMVR